MSGTSAHLTLRPDRCNECGACVAACPQDAIRATDSYILVDSKACNQCCACVEACSRAAIVRAAVPTRSTTTMPSVALGDVPKVVVGSRAEAKAVRKAAEQAAKQASKAASRSNVVALPSAARTPRAGSAAHEKGRESGGATGANQSVQFGAVDWRAPDVAVVLGLLLVTLLGKNALLAAPSVGLMPASGRILVRAVVLACFYAVQFAGLAFLAARRGVGLADAFGLGRQTDAKAERPSLAGSVGLVMLLLVGTEAVSISYGLAVQALGWKQPPVLSSDLAAAFGGGLLGLAASIVLVAFVAPLAEELAFRGVLLPALGRSWGMWPAIVLSSLLYAAYHLNVWLFLPTVVLGVALGWLAWTRRSLWPAILLHILYNGVAVAAAFLLAR